MTPGEVLLVDLEPVTGNEQGGLRPAVVISNTGYDQLVAGRLLVVCPITSRDRELAHHVPVTRAPTHRLNRPSWVMCEQPRTISSRRVNRSLGTLTPADVDRVATVVHRLLHRG
ncbi:type II toxin-antitoxin system PemK/MazF family toxin [Frankia sp. CiP3]|uniref:type II toxin-antitoxin system PemK/MazF family toxin n=1 Tax=Frankia sp. CiP3 TaxID=2880971 RepID=UPI001EF4280E|nr:type II toxin-antitoxin system PemK/MazF family toxin [Frankia sp. CiP3]